jgi:hypothetical protein
MRVPAGHQRPGVAAAHSHQYVHHQLPVAPARTGPRLTDRVPGGRGRFLLPGGGGPHALPGGADLRARSEKSDGHTIRPAAATRSSRPPASWAASTCWSTTSPPSRAAHPDGIAPSYVFFAAGRLSATTTVRCWPRWARDPAWLGDAVPGESLARDLRDRVDGEIRLDAGSSTSMGGPGETADPPAAQRHRDHRLLGLAVVEPFGPARLPDLPPRRAGRWSAPRSTASCGRPRGRHGMASERAAQRWSGKWAVVRFR